MEPERWREVRAELELYLALPDEVRERALAEMSAEAQRLIECETADAMDALVRSVRGHLPPGG